MVHCTAPNSEEQQASSPGVRPTPPAGRQSPPHPGKKRKLPANVSSREETLKVLLPPNRRRPLLSRLDEVLADPCSVRCLKPCTICAEVLDVDADAVLAEWDALARSGAWPITVTQIRAALQTRDITIGYKPVRDIVSHRRWMVLNRLVREDIDAWQREENAGSRNNSPSVSCV